MMEFTSEQLVIVPVGFAAPGMLHHVAGKVVSQAEMRGGAPGVWVNVNIGGSHLPQAYLVSELEGMPTLDAAEAPKHGFCPTCLGFGYEGAQLCGTCFGSGRPTMRAFTFEEPGSTEVTLELDVQTAGTFECELCRRACTPQDLS